MRKIALLAAALIGGVAAWPAESASAAGPVPLPVGEAGFTVTLDHPATFRQGNPFAVSGHVYAVLALPIVLELSRGVPNQSVDILIDGQRKATVPTSGEGYYQAQFFLSEEQSSHTVQAVLFRGTPAEVRSPLHTVHADQVFSAVWLDRSQVTLERGQSTQLRAYALDGDGRERDVTNVATWSSSAPGVASVNGGLVQALSVGSASITATMGTASAAAAITVIDNGRDG